MSGTGWLDTWKAKAETKRAGLVSSPDTVSPIRALPRLPDPHQRAAVIVAR